MSLFRCGVGGLSKELIFDGVLPDAYTNVNVTIPAGTKALALIVTNPDDNDEILKGDVLIYNIYRSLNSYSQSYYKPGDTSKYLTITINVSQSLLRLGGGNGMTMSNVPVKLYAVDLSPEDF